MLTAGPLTAIPEFNKALDVFVAATQARLNDDYARNSPTLGVPDLTAERGSKYVRIVKSGGGSRSVFCFVRIADGAVLKAASWKAPAKGERGSIYVKAGQDAVNSYGAHYRYRAGAR